LALTFITVVVASASTIMLYSYLDTRERQTELALLRTMGFTRGQLNGVVWLGLGLVVLLGVAVGTWAGQALASALLPLLEVAEEGRRVVPPMVLQVNWLTLFWYYLLLGAVGILTAFGLMWLLAKRRIHQVLRIGEA
jgi:ABC-type antimicrobial peptide transport system permease subunit